MAAEFVSEDDVLQRYSSATTFPPSNQFSQVKYDEIEVVPRALGYGASDIPYDVHPGTHAYAGLDNNLQYPVVVKLLQDMPHVPDDNLGNGSELEHFSLRQGVGDDEKPGPIANFATTYHWTVCGPGIVGSLKQLFRDQMNVTEQQVIPSDVLIKKRDEWLNQLRRDNPWHPMKTFAIEWPRPNNGLQSAPFQFNGQLPVFRDYKVTKKLLRLIHNFEKKYPRDILPKGQMIFAVFVWHYLQQRAEDAPYEAEAVWPACQVPLGHFIIYFIEYLKRTEVFQLAYYAHPFHFVDRAYDHDWKRDSEKYGISGSGISSEEVEEEMRKINPVLVGSFYPHHIMHSSIPSFTNAHVNVPADAAHSLHTARSLIGPIGKWTWHDYDNHADKVPTHHLLIPHDLCDDFRIVKGVFKGDSEIESHRARRLTEDGVFLYTFFQPSHTPELDALVDQQSIKNGVLPSSPSMVSALSDFSPERAVFAVINACRLIHCKPMGTVHMNKQQTCSWLLEYTLVLMSVTARVDHAVITLAGYGVLDRDNLSLQKIIRKHGEWVLDGFVPNEFRPLDSVEVNELNLAVAGLFKREELVRHLGVSFGAILELAKDDNADKRRFVVKILMELCLPLTAHTLYAILVLHVLERQVEAQERQIKPDAALHIYSNLLVLQQIKRDLASDPPKPFCQVVLTDAIQYQPEAAARELLGLKEALNDTMGTFVHESLKDCF